MRPRLFWMCVLTLAPALPVSRPAFGAEAARPAAAPAARAMGILRENCLACHNPQKKKGGLLLTSRQDALRGGDDGPALAPGDAGKSRLAGVLPAGADPHMPPKGQLPEGEIAALREWIDAGAEFDDRLLNAAPAAPATRAVALRPLPGSYHPVLALALSPDQTRLAAGRGDHVLLFDLASKGRPLLRDLPAPHDLVQSLAWSADGKWLASGGFRRVRLWDTHSPHPARELTGPAGRVTALAFAPAGPELYAAEGEAALPGVIHAWQVPLGNELESWPAHADAVLAMKISADGKLLVTGGADKLVKAWAMPGHAEAGKFEGHSAQVMAVAVNRDATLLASAGTDKEVKIWDVKTRDQTVALQTHPAGVTDLSWVNDKTLLSACEDGLARLSSKENKERPERTFSGAGDVLYCAAATTDGTVYAGCHDGCVYVWTPAGKLDGKLDGRAPPAASGG